MSGPKVLTLRWQGKQPLVVVLLCVLTAGPVLGQAGGEAREEAQPGRMLNWPTRDAGALVKGLTKKRALYALGVGGVLIGLSRYDEGLTTRAAEITDGPAIKVVEEFGNVKAVRPMAMVVMIGALMTEDRQLRDASFTSLEAIVFANLITNALKLVFGRARPWQGEGPSTFRPFSGNTSFPSGHSTTVFALVTPWLVYYPGYLAPGLALLAASTAFSRMATNFHWFTDVVAGSTIGMVTGLWLARRHRRHRTDVRVTPRVGPNEVGVTVRF